MNEFGTANLDSIVHIIQLSLAPIFLLTAVATLLNVFTQRLARISDQAKAVSQARKPDEPNKQAAELRLAYLRRRTHALDAAVILGALAGASTCGTVLTLFFGALRDRTTIGVLFFLYGAGILCTIAALAAFLTEVLLGSRGIRADVAEGFERMEW